VRLTQRRFNVAAINPFRHAFGKRPLFAHAVVHCIVCARQQSPSPQGTNRTGAKGVILLRG